MYLLQNLNKKLKHYCRVLIFYTLKLGNFVRSRHCGLSLLRTRNDGPLSVCVITRVMRMYL